MLTSKLLEGTQLRLVRVSKENMLSGVFRVCPHREGLWHSMLLFGLFRPEWENRVSER